MLVWSSVHSPKEAISLQSGRIYLSRIRRKIRCVGEKPVGNDDPPRRFAVKVVETVENGAIHHGGIIGFPSHCGSSSLCGWYEKLRFSGLTTRGPPVSQSAKPHSRHVAVNGNPLDDHPLPVDLPEKEDLHAEARLATTEARLDQRFVARRIESHLRQQQSAPRAWIPSREF